MESPKHPEAERRSASSSSGSGTEGSPAEEDGEHALLLQPGTSSEDGRTQPLLQVSWILDI